MISKGDTVRSSTVAAIAGNGFVHYILPDGMAMVEFAAGRKAYIHTDNLTTVDLPINEGWAAPSSISHNGRE